MRDKNQKKQQKLINKVVRSMNENIQNDELWKGRFYGHQIKADYYKYPDGSGGSLTTWIELVDKKTGKTKIITLQYFHVDAFVYSDMFKEMNNFIIEDVKVWDEEGMRK